MPANANIVINDGAATPVAHTFKPSRIDGDVAIFFEDKTSLIGRPKLTVGVRNVATGGDAHKVQIRVTQPKVITTTDQTGKSVTSVDYEDLGTIELMYSKRGSASERKDLRVLLSNALMNGSIGQVIDNGEFFW